MKLRLSVAFAAVVVVVGLLATIRTRGADEPENPAPPPTFIGKCVAISVLDQYTGACLEKVEIRKLGGREFLVGTVVPANDRYAVINGKTQWISLEKVTSIYEFKDLDDLKSVSALFQDQRPRQTKGAEK